MAGIVIIEFEKSGGGTVNNADHHLPANLDQKAKELKIVFEAPNAPKGEINNGNSFPTGIYDSGVDQTPAPQA